MKAGYLQFEPVFGKPDTNISKIDSLLKDKEFDLLVLPELASSGYVFTSMDEVKELSEETGKEKFSKFLIEVCAEKNAHIVSGICERDGNKFYNSSILVYPDGRIFTYRKIHLFDEEKFWFSPGDKKAEVYEVSGKNYKNVKIGMMICFDWFFPETARTLALKGAQIICHPSNLVLSFCQKSMFTRAVENKVYTITANRTGKDVREGKELSFTGESVMVSPRGDYLCRASLDRDEVCIAEIDPQSASDKKITDNNNLFEDRRTEFYF